MQLCYYVAFGHCVTFLLFQNSELCFGVDAFFAYCDFVQFHSPDFPVTSTLFVTLADAFKGLPADAERLEVSLAYFSSDFARLLDVIP